MTAKDLEAGVDPAHQTLARKSAALASAMRALAHEQRLMILGLVATEEKSVGEIEKIMRIPQPAVSQQLARLREDDLVSVRRKGRTVFYLTNTETVTTVLAQLASLAAVAEPVTTGATATDLPTVDEMISAGTLRVDDAANRTLEQRTVSV